MLKLVQDEEKTLWLESKHYFHYNDMNTYVCFLNNENLQIILPDYYQEFIDKYQNFFNEVNGVFNASDYELHKMLNDFLLLYDKQMIIFKLINQIPILILRKEDVVYV